MFPFSARLDAVSKSNSSRRLPWTTTTRISSGCVASINMRRAINDILHSATGPASPEGGGRRVLGYGTTGWRHGALLLGARLDETHINSALSRSSRGLIPD